MHPTAGVFLISGSDDRQAPTPPLPADLDRRGRLRPAAKAAVA